MEKFIVAVLKFVNSVALSILNGYTLATLWGWFVVTTFGAPVITIPIGIGLYMLVKFVTMKKPSDQDVEAEDSYYKAATFGYAKALLTLLVGLIVKQFV